MKIIKPGIPEATKEYEYSCNSCGCVFTAKKEEYTLHVEARDADFWSITCPEEFCNATIFRYSF